jgi:hypothetical protein
MEQQIFLPMELPEEPFKLVPETRKDIEKRARAANKQIERTAERNRLNRLAKNLKLDFKPLITLQKIKEAMENGPYKSFVTFSSRQMYEFKQDAESLYLVDMRGAKAAEWHLMSNGEIERVTLSGESKMIFKWEAESLKG